MCYIQLLIFLTFQVCLSALVAIAQCGPLNAVLTSGLPAGPVHPQVGNLVATRRGPRPIDLEGFSEDDNQDGFVDPIAPAGMYYSPKPPWVRTLLTPPLLKHNTFSSF